MHHLKDFEALSGGSVSASHSPAEFVFLCPPPLTNKILWQPRCAQLSALVRQVLLCVRVVCDLHGVDALAHAVAPVRGGAGAGPELEDAEAPGPALQRRTPLEGREFLPDFDERGLCSVLKLGALERARHPAVRRGAQPGHLTPAFAEALAFGTLLGEGHALLLDDAYNASPASMAAASSPPVCDAL